MTNGTCPGHHDAVAICTANTHANGCGVAVEASHTMDGANGQAVACAVPEIAAILDMQGGKIGANFTMGDGAVPAITRGRGSADDVHSIAIGIDPYNSASTGDVSKTLNTAVAQDTDHTGAVAIGIGRDAFNSGKNAQMAQSFSTEVQPPITAKGPGGVCTNGEPRTGRM